MHTITSSCRRRHEYDIQGCESAILKHDLLLNAEEGESALVAEAKLPQVVGDDQPGFGELLNLRGGPAGGVFP